MAFQNSSRLSKIGPSLGGLTQSGSQNLGNSGDQHDDEKESRFTIIDKMLTADQELNGADFDDVFQ